ncbi:MAG: glutamate--tRNA ligase [Sphingomonadales bacterium]|nr:glutamate--tRNA ligase [Sphingomonadales bacterium]
MKKQTTHHQVVTRFAPSPTGFLHIGGARTALFNWLFAKSQGGKYLVRIEDTDKKRSTTEAIDAINDGLTWLGLGGDEAPVFQSQQQARHSEVVAELLAAGNAYPCYASPEELQEMRDKARAEGRTVAYDGMWRDRDHADAPKDIKPVIRLKTPADGITEIADMVQGTVKVPNKQLDDMVLLRSDGTPTYMLSVVVDDHDMGITHIIRGDDHLTNAFRQQQLYGLLGWQAPEFGHIPLIHGSDGAKLSKRHGALGVDAYRDMGYLPEALNNYLLRLGWGYEDKELIGSDEALELFNINGVGKSPSRFDFKKLDNFNQHYMRNLSHENLMLEALPFVERKLERTLGNAEKELFVKAMTGLKDRAKTLIELAESSLFYFKTVPLDLNEKAEQLLDNDNRVMLAELCSALEAVTNWSHDSLLETVESFVASKELKLGKVAQPMRAALTGSNVSPSVFDIMDVLGREKSLARIKQVSKN